MQCSDQHSASYSQHCWHATTKGSANFCCVTFVYFAPPASKQADKLLAPKAAAAAAATTTVARRHSAARGGRNFARALRCARPVRSLGVCCEKSARARSLAASSPRFRNAPCPALASKATPATATVLAAATAAVAHSYRGKAALSVRACVRRQLARKPAQARTAAGVSCALVVAVVVCLQILTPNSSSRSC